MEVRAVTIAVLFVGGTFLFGTLIIHSVECVASREHSSPLPNGSVVEPPGATEEEGIEVYRIQNLPGTEIGDGARTTMETAQETPGDPVVAYLRRRGIIVSMTLLPEEWVVEFNVREQQATYGHVQVIEIWMAACWPDRQFRGEDFEGKDGDESVVVIRVPRKRED